mmetsp:Transcript_65845/g.203970  ORF Transcript_65845/g.203970 Transcript_65845/m.203970 type:complete len:280 (+) Transcript_65845:240-1079(+)
MPWGCCSVMVTPYLRRCLASVLSALTRIFTSFGADFRLSTGRGFARLLGDALEVAAKARRVEAASSACSLRFRPPFSLASRSLSLRSSEQVAEAFSAAFLAFASSPASAFSAASAGAAAGGLAGISTVGRAGSALSGSAGRRRGAFRAGVSPARASAVAGRRRRNSGVLLELPPSAGCGVASLGSTGAGTAGAGPGAAGTGARDTAACEIHRAFSANLLRSASGRSSRPRGRSTTASSLELEPAGLPFGTEASGASRGCRGGVHAAAMEPPRPLEREAA